MSQPPQPLNRGLQVRITTGPGQDNDLMGGDGGGKERGGGLFGPDLARDTTGAGRGGQICGFGGGAYPLV